MARDIDWQSSNLELDIPLNIIKNKWNKPIRATQIWSSFKNSGLSRRREKSLSLAPTPTRKYSLRLSGFFALYQPNRIAGTIHLARHYKPPPRLSIFWSTKKTCPTGQVNCFFGGGGGIRTRVRRRFWEAFYMLIQVFNSRLSVRLEGQSRAKEPLKI